MLEIMFILGLLSAVFSFSSLFIFSVSLYMFFRLGKSAKAYMFNRPKFSSQVLVLGPISVIILTLGEVLHFLSHYSVPSMYFLSEILKVIGFAVLFFCSLAFFRLFSKKKI